MALGISIYSKDFF